LTDLLTYLTPQEKDEINKILDDILWYPATGNKAQQMAYDLALSGAAMEMGYGGQAGGGKTDLLLGLAGTVFHKSMIFRREYTQLSDVIERGNALFPTQFISGEKKHWRFNNHLIRLRHAQYESDWTKYQGMSNAFLGFDEAAEFPEITICSITGWNRASPGQRTLTLLCFNPPTSSEGEWIVRMFAPWIAPDYPGTRAEPGEIRWFVRDGDDHETEVPNGEPFLRSDGTASYPISRTFIPASRYDNPYLGEDYERRLDNLPEPLRSMVRDGDFTVSTKDDQWQVIPTNWVLQAQARWREMKNCDTVDNIDNTIKMRTMGVDVARGGADQTVFAPLYGTWFDDLHIFPGAETPDGAGVAVSVVEAMKGQNPRVCIDVVGWGASAYDHLKVLNNVNAVPVNNGAGSNRVDKSGKFNFSNIRAASYWALREALDPDSGENIALPDNRDLRVDLCAAKYKIVGGRIQLESKDDIKKRLRRSPDLADAVVLAWWGTLLPVFAMDWV